MNRDSDIERLLDEAERHGLCVTAADDNQRRKLARRVLCGELTNPHPRLYIRTGMWEGLNPIKRKRTMVRTLARLYPDMVFAAESAVCMFDLEQPYDIHPDNELTVASPSRSGIRVFSKTGFTKRTLYVPNMQPVTLNGVRVTSLTRTLFDCARLLPFECMLPIADSAAKSGVDMASLTQFPTSRFDEANKIASILTYADPLSDNGGESRARAVMIAGGYMLPHLQYQFPNMDNPEFPLRVDFIWFLPGDVTVVGEYDGMAKYGNTWTEVNTHVNKQCKRDDYLRKHGVTTIVHFSFDDVIHRELLYRKLDDAGIPRMH
ncbi:hypothetical protein [Bifidobacterium pseudolongum]|uniref:hypothetical protein n=1 Tax=Bifidobacterium pseudolongum TaxID=1694 RepID=UPI001021CE1A|nr:hypothetical protein [Bifidobacterium pseudolongum]